MTCSRFLPVAFQLKVYAGVGISCHRGASFKIKVKRVKRKIDVAIKYPLFNVTLPFGIINLV